MNEDDFSTIKSNVAQFISNNNDRYEVISIFQDNLNNITEESYTDTITFTENNLNIFFSKIMKVQFYFCITLFIFQFTIIKS